MYGANSSSFPRPVASGRSFAAAAQIGVSLWVLGAAVPAAAAVFTVVNTRNSGVGSLRTAITSANGIPGSTIQFSIPTSDTGYSAATGVFTIRLTSTLPAIIAAGTILDATTQTTNRGDTNPGVLGTGGTVGVDGLVLPTVPRPEILLLDAGGLAIGLELRAANIVVRGLGIYGFGTATNSDASADIRVANTATNTWIERNIIGSTPVAWADPGAGNRSGGDHLRIVGVNSGTIRNNLIGFGNGKGIEFNTNTTGWLVEGNELRRNGIGSANLDAMDIENGSGSITVRGNLIVDSEACGVEAYQSSGANVIVNNTIQGNGIGSGAGLENSGVRLYGSASIVDRNIISGNVGAGVMVAATSNNNTITRNSIFSNGRTTGQIGIDLLSAADNVNLGTSPYVTRNDAGDVDTGANGLSNFPVFAVATLQATQLTVSGFAAPGLILEVFVADGDASGFGEGQTYLFTAVEGSAADLDSGTGTYTNPVNGLNQGTDTTNRFLFSVATPPGVVVGTRLTATGRLGTATAEFSGVVVVAGAPSITLVKAVSPVGAQVPGSELTYSTVFANAGGAPAYTVVVHDPIPSQCDFKVGSPFANLGTTGLGVATEYSSDGGTTWAYVPADGAGGAPAGFDRIVNAVRWSFSGTLAFTAPANQGSVGFTTRIR